MLRVHTFGGCHVERDGVRSDELSGQRKALALLSLLAVADKAGLSREAVLAFLWPESDDERARTSLKQLVHTIRTQLRAPDLLTGLAGLRLNPAVVTSDVGEFNDAVWKGDHASAAALYRGPFLDGFYLKGGDAFERWAATQRSSLAQKAARALEALAQQATARRDVREAVELWRRLVEVDPLSARASVGLMRALDAVGERPAALRYAQLYATLVEQQVGGAPDPSVTELARVLREGQPLAPPSDIEGAPTAATKVPAAEAADLRPRPASPLDTARRRRRPPIRAVAAGLLVAGALGALVAWGLSDAAADDRARRDPRPSVAVLPFVNTSGDTANEPFSDGLTDELIGALGRVPELRVIARTSAFELKGQPLDARAAAQRLGVDHVVEGSVRRDGGRLRVTTQLVSAADDAVRWAEAYDREVKDVFSVQEQIARSIVGALRVRFAAHAASPLVGTPTADAAAYDLYLRGRYVWNTRLTEGGIRQSIRYFERAIARDPTFARAHAGLSDAYARLAAFGYVRPPEGFSRAKAAAQRALSLDSTLAQAHVALAHTLWVYDFQMVAAGQHLRRAIALDPGYTSARINYAVWLSSQGRFVEAVAQLDSARAVDPLAPAISNVLGRVHVAARRPDDAIRHLREALERDPQLDLAYQQLGHAYLQKGMRADAIDAFRRAAELSGVRDSAHLAYAYAVTGEPATARQIVRALLQSAWDRYIPPYHLAVAYAGLGEREEAFRWLERAYAERGSFVAGAKVDPALEFLHADPRWPALIARIEGRR